MHVPPVHPTYETKAYLAKCKESILKITRTRNETIHKLTPEESSTINAVIWNLRTNELIIIKPADKNLGPTIMDRKWYISAGELVLQDKIHIMPLQALMLTLYATSLSLFYINSDTLGLRTAQTLNTAHGEMNICSTS